MNPAWEEAIEGCLGYLATEKSHALNSQLINRIALESFAAWMDQHHPGLEPALLMKEHLRSYLRAQRTERKLAPSSMKIIVVALRHFFAHLKRENLIAHDLSAALDLPRLDRLLPEMLSEADVDQLLSLELPGTALGLRDRALLEVLYASGLRAAELAGLRLENYLREEKLLRVIGKGNRERVVPVGEKAIAALDRLARARPAAAWSSPRLAAKFSWANMDGESPPRASGRSSSEMAKLCGPEETDLAPSACATRSQPICSATARTCVRSRRCSATPVSPPRRSTPTSTRRGSNKSIASFIRGLDSSD